jgi:PAS domain S-box-containing protein
MAGIYRRQAAVLLLAVMAPWIGNALYLSGYSPIPKLDLTPFAFTVTVVAFTLGIFGFQLVDLSPIARTTVVDEMEAGMIVLDLSNRIVDINPSALKTIGVTGSEVLGRNAGEVLAAWPELTSKYSRVMEATDEITIGTGAEQRWFELQLTPLHDHRQGVVGRVITVTNITARKQAENLLVESEARYRQIVESASDIIYRTDIKGRFTYANPIAMRLMGFKSEADVIGKHFLEFAAPYLRHDLKRFYDRQFVSGEKNTYYEFAAISTDGREIWLGQNVQIIEDSTGFIGFQAVARDITELKRTQDELAKARDKALEASRLKSQLLAKVSHELRTPLGGILGYAELLHINAFGRLSEKQKNASAQIIDSTHYLTKLVNELLDEAQIESKTLRLFRERLSPVELLQRVETGMSVLTRKKNLEFTTRIDPRLPRMLYGDEQRLEQILVNLVGNAIKFTEKGTIGIYLYRCDDEYWALEVADTGTGIPEDAREYIFEPFRQVDNSNTTHSRGTGLGLSITKQLVELMKGKITLVSEVGKGSTFTVVLPIQYKPEEPA